MNSQRLVLGRVDDIHVESFGEPGQRTFRVRVEKLGGVLSLWLEKFQVELLGAAVTELLAQTPETDPAGEGEGGITFLGDLDVHVGSLSLAYHSAQHVFQVEATEFDSAFDLESITFQANRQQFSAVRSDIEAIVAASRPRCVLCGTPLTGEPHFCPEQNGHAKLKVEDPD